MRYNESHIWISHVISVLITLITVARAEFVAGGVLLKFEEGVDGEGSRLPGTEGVAEEGGLGGEESLI